MVSMTTMATGKSFYILFIPAFLNIALEVQCDKMTLVNSSEEASYHEEKHGVVNIRNHTDFMSNCSLNISDDTKYIFTTTVLRNKYNFVNFELELNFDIKESDDVIQYKRWVWTYKGENGGFQNLFLPINSGYLSFGLLWTHTFTGPMKIKLSGKGTCNNLISGNYTDKLIGAALAEMTEDIAEEDDIYNSSHWCHFVRINLTGPIHYICKNIVCPYQTFEYRCCTYKIDFVTKQRDIECNHKHYYLGSVWWELSFFLGNLVWAYFPLFLIYIGYNMRNATKSRDVNVEMENVLEEDPNELMTEEFVYLYKNSYPITFLGTLKQAFCICNTENVVVSRLLRLMIIILPLSVLTIQILLDKIFEDKLFKEAISKDAYSGFYTLSEDFQTARKNFLVIFGGPHIAMILYLFFSCLFIQLPKDLESFIAGGLFEFRQLGLSPLTLNLENKCRLAGLQCNKLTGFSLVYYSLSSNLLLLFNIRFWSQTFKIILYRWKQIIYPFLRKVDSSCLLAGMLIPLFLLYILFCLCEFVIMLLVYLLPITYFIFILFKAYIVKITNLCKNHSNVFVKHLRYFFIPFTVLALPFTWYIYSQVLFQCLLFFTDILLYTYSGIIAYPRISYGYLVLVFMIVYYTVEILNQFGKSYQTLLRTAIKESEKVNLFSSGNQTVEIPDNKGIPKVLWELIVERHQARRLNMMATVLYLLILISVLYISVDLLERFNKFQELSVLTHVFTVLVICALPKIVRSLYMDKLCSHDKHKLRREIQRTISDFLDGTTEDHVQVYGFVSQHEYEEISE